MKHIFTLFLVSITFATFAQTEYQLSQAMDFFRTNKMINGELKSTLTEADIKGSPYLNDEFLDGSVYTSSKLQYNDIPLRYNVYNDEMQSKSPDGNIAAIAAPEVIEKVTFGDYTMEYIPFTNAKKIRRGFVILVAEGDVSLYARPNVEFRAAVPPAPYKGPEPAKFLEKPNTYYIRIGMEEARLVENKKDLEAVFPDHQKEVSSFIKKNKVNHRKEDKLKELVEYYNSL